MFGSFLLRKKYFSHRCLNLVEIGFSELPAATGVGFL